jgi:hypothetical protein
VTVAPIGSIRQRHKKKKLCSFTGEKTTEFTKRSVKKLSSLGCLDGVEFLFFAGSNGLDMGGNVAVAVFPF